MYVDYTFFLFISRFFNIILTSRTHKNGSNERWRRIITMKRNDEVESASDIHFYGNEHKTNIFEHLRWSADSFLRALLLLPMHYASFHFLFFFSKKKNSFYHNDVAIHQIHPEHSRDVREEWSQAVCEYTKKKWIKRKISNIFTQLFCFFLFLAHCTEWNFVLF